MKKKIHDAIWLTRYGLVPIVLSIAAILSAGCGSGGSKGSSAAGPDVNAIVTMVRSTSKVPALAAAYISLGAAGVRKAGSPETVTKADYYQVGSTTKSMTAALAGVLVEAGEIRWDTTVAEAFPSFASQINPAFADVTLEQLLQHRGGVLPLESLDDILALPKFSGTNREQRQQFTQWALSQAPASQIGTFAYSNGGYAVAGAMLEAAANDNWEDLIVTKVLGKVGARPTFGSPRLNDPNQPWGHLEDGDTFTPYDQRTGYSIPPYLYPAGGINLSVTDLARYAQAHLRGLHGDNGIVSAATFARLHTPTNGTLPGYADGWVEFTQNGERIAIHDGSDGVYYALMIVLPNRGIAAVAITNSGDTPRRGSRHRYRSAPYRHYNRPGQLPSNFQSGSLPKGRQATMNRRTALRGLLVLPFGLSAITAGCGSGNSGTPPSDTNRAAELLKAYAARNPRAGVAAAIVRGGSLLWSAGLGAANSELNIPASDESVYLIASISKTVTAAAVLQLTETGRLNLDMDINTYLPFRITNPKNSSSVITLRHLLTHTSGIVDDYYNEISYPALYFNDMDPTLSLADFCRAIFAPGGSYYSADTFTTDTSGTHYTYSNIGVALAGYIVETAAGESFAEYTKEHIFLPLGMTKTSWRVSDFRKEEMAMPYDENEVPLTNYTFADYPDGGLRTNVKDLSRFLRAFLLGGSLQGRTILRPESVQEIKRHQYPNIEGAEMQGLGWYGLAIGPYAELFGHAGAERGISMGMAFNPATGSGAIVFRNRGLVTEEDVTSLQNIIASLIALGEGK